MRFKFVNTLLFACTVAATPVAAQSPFVSGGWGHLGVGFGSDSGTAITMGLAAQFDGHLIEFRAASVAEFFDDGVYDVGVLYGRATQGRVGRVSVSAGVAMVGGQECNPGGILFQNCTELAAKPGVPVSVQFTLTPFPILGIGVYAFANMNSHQNFGGVTLMAQLGKLW